ncbi:MAG: hypothetical protein PHT18_06960 [Proteiniphilum sp.]|nr:hypothetical protein [Proteiniphilum sp.]
MKITTFLLALLFVVTACKEQSNETEYQLDALIALKTPGNQAVEYGLKEIRKGGTIYLEADEKLPLTIRRKVSDGSITVTLKAEENLYFNFKQLLHSSFKHEDCQFYMPGFWYRRNLRSPDRAPSFHTSDSWTVREDRLSTPMTAIFNEVSGAFTSVMRIDDFRHEALATHTAGEVIISGNTSIGYTGFENLEGESAISFGFPYQETPRTYIRKLSLADPVEAFHYLPEGTSMEFTWQIREGKAADFSDFVRQMWEYGFDTWRPEPVETGFSDSFVKETLTHYFTDSYVSDKPLKYNSGEWLQVATCEPNGRAEVGFVGRVLLNAFNALEYGEQNGRDDLTGNSRVVFNSYLEEGFSPNGFFREFVNFDNHSETDVYSIRRQSEGIYAMLHFLQYEKNNGRTHVEWEGKIQRILEQFLLLQQEDGSFPRKFRDDLSLVDSTGGSTPSATLPLVMAYTYFDDNHYLQAAKRTADYLEREIISKADYFSSTLDANCEDKEASLYASTATYYLALVSEGEEQQRYADLSLRSAYFALSWYYLWDVPFARGQMIGDIGMKTRGWGNVSVENNHIDVFIFEFGSVLKWLSERYGEPRFTQFLEVISSSMRQLLPYEGHLSGVAKPGYYPEVVQHTQWDYGRNGKGFYNDIFASGWTVASLWELLTPGRAEQFLQSAAINQNK